MRYCAKTGETGKVLAAEIETDPKRFLRFPTKYEIHEYRIIKDFIEPLSPGKVQSDLSYSIPGKGNFRRFKESISTSISMMPILDTQVARAAGSISPFSR